MNKINEIMNERRTALTDTTERHEEMLTSAVTLSDMEIFIFPELLIAGALANLMSPLIWEWKRHPHFQNMDALTPYQRILRVKQFIIDHYTFNLDLETWGLTTKGQEKDRFAPFVDFDAVEESNALMGYEGDQYYYDIDIRRHFGLEKYTTDVLPYWKTETIEAMDAFRRKEGRRQGAGECVSLSMLYFAALHIVAGIPLSQMYMMATPLHSQNFVDVDGGMLTNNRRIVTKSMWFNGTPLSTKAQCALRFEKVTIVANMTGYVHTIYDEATMAPEDYAHFCCRIADYLTPPMTVDILYAFMRHCPEWQRCFYFGGRVKDTRFFATAEALYAFDDSDGLRVTGQTANKLMQKLPAADRLTAPPAERVRVDELRVKTFRRLRRDNRADWPELIGLLIPQLDEVSRRRLAEDLYAFCFIEPRLPQPLRYQGEADFAAVDACQSPAEVIALVDSLRTQTPVAELAFAAYRDLNYSSWQPFLRAALLRNPVAVQAMAGRSAAECVQAVAALADESIYSGDRLAQPDEVWNFGCGDGLERAILLWDLLAARGGETAFALSGNTATVTAEGQTYRFTTAKSLPPAAFVWRDGELCSERR